MKVSAYVLAADPAWIEASVGSYYEHVERIVVSYAADGRGWTGEPIAAAECVGRLKAMDVKGKMVFVPGEFARLEHEPLANDTHQRQQALEKAGEFGEWVVQLDTDEVMLSAETFWACLKEADGGGFAGLDYPARWLYRQLGGGRYLEMCSRFWRTAASFPGPTAVRRGTRLTCARQIAERTMRVDFRSRNTDLWGDAGREIHRVVRREEGILHYSWVRPEEWLRKKFSTWGHAKDKDWSVEYERWRWAGRHPYLKMALCPLARGNRFKHFRIVSVGARAAGLAGEEGL